MGTYTASEGNSQPFVPLIPFRWQLLLLTSEGLGILGLPNLAFSRHFEEKFFSSLTSRWFRDHVLQVMKRCFV